MCQATTSRMPASVAIGMCAASGPATARTTSRVAACVRPAIGVVPPLRMLVAVRAIAPVAGIPPKSGDAMLATPWATSSVFARCRLPVSESATTADSSDSMAASSAMVNAGVTSSGRRCSDTFGKRGHGRPRGSSPNREPMVSTGMRSR